MFKNKDDLNHLLIYSIIISIISIFDNQMKTFVPIVDIIIINKGLYWVRLDGG